MDNRTQLPLIGRADAKSALDDECDALDVVRDLVECVAHHEHGETIAIVQRTANVSPALATRDYDELSGMFNPTGRFNPAALAVLSRSFVEMGMLPQEPDIKSLVTEEFLPGAKR